MATVKDLPKLSEWLKEQRESMKASLEKKRKQARIYLALVRLLDSHGVEVEASLWDAEYGDIRLEVFEKDDRGRIRFTWQEGQLRPVLRRTAQGVPYVAILARVLGARLSQAEYSYPGKTDTPHVYHCTATIPLKALWVNFKVHFPALFHDRDNQPCRVESNRHESETMVIVCRRPCVAGV
jgi:hypothetical protein